MKLWLDASDLTTAGPTWSDKSGNLNHAIKNGSPTISTYNGKSVMRYSGSNGEYHSWTKMDDIRTVFWVVRKEGTDSNRFLLGDWTGSGNDGSYHFHSNGANMFANWSSAYSATTNQNGTQITDTGAVPVSSSLSILSLKKTSNLTASNFSNDRNYGGRTWKGDLGELIIFNTEVSDADIQKIEGYLAHKWGLQDSLPTSHPHYLGAPIASSGTPDYIDDSPFGSGKAIDLANGHVEIPTGEAEDVFDGGAAFSVSAWVKGASKQALGSIISKGPVR